MRLESVVDIIAVLWSSRPVNRASIAGSGNRRFFHGVHIGCETPPASCCMGKEKTLLVGESTVQ